MTTLREFEEVLREQGIDSALKLLEGMKEFDRNWLSTDRLNNSVDGRKMTSVLAEQVLILHGNTSMTSREVAFGLILSPGRVGKRMRPRRWSKESSSPPGTAVQDRAQDCAVSVPEKSPQPANGSLLPNDEDNAALHQFSELTETLEATADLLQQEISDDLRERRIALTQICETQNVIQKKIDEANEWLARRVG